MTGPLPSNRTVRAFLRGMAELGYVYGRDFVTEPQGTDAIGAVAELVGLQLDLGLSCAIPSTRTYLPFSSTSTTSNGLSPMFSGRCFPPGANMAWPAFTVASCDLPSG